MILDEKLEKFLTPPIKSTTFLKTQFDGIIIVTSKSIVMATLNDVQATIPRAKFYIKLPLDTPVFNLIDFHSSYRFIGWTPQGNILQIHISDRVIDQHLVWEKSEKKEFLSAAFVQPDANHFAAIDGDNNIQVYSIQTKEEVWRHHFPMKCTSLVAHPKLPILHVLSEDGRVLVVAIMIKVTMPARRDEYGEEDEDFDSEEEQGELVERTNANKEPIIEVFGKVIREIRIHPNELNFNVFDNTGAFMAIGGRDFGKIFLCDTQTNPKPFKLSPVPGPLGKKKKRFQPSFKSPTDSQSSMEETQSMPEEGIQPTSLVPG